MLVQNLDLAVKGNIRTYLGIHVINTAVWESQGDLWNTTTVLEYINELFALFTYLLKNLSA